MIFTDLYSDFYSKKVIPVVEQWDDQAFDAESFLETLKRRWRTDDPDLFPAAFSVQWRDQQWYDSLQLYLLGDHSAHADAILNAFQTVYDEVSPNLSHGDVWFYDVLALRRYRGANVGSALKIVVSALELVSDAIPVWNTPTISVFADLYGEAAKVLVIETSEEELCNASYLSGMLEAPYEAYSIFRDAKIDDMGTDHHSVLNSIEDLCGRFYDRISGFYYLPEERRYSCEILGDLHAEFDLPVLLFAAGVEESKHEAGERFCDLVIEYNRDMGMPILVSGFSPTRERVRERVTSYRNTQRVLFDSVLSIQANTDSTVSARRDHLPLPRLEFLQNTLRKIFLKTETTKPEEMDLLDDDAPGAEVAASILNILPILGDHQNRSEAAGEH